jgi:hypothetical protein
MTDTSEDTKTVDDWLAWLHARSWQVSIDRIYNSWVELSIRHGVTWHYGTGPSMLSALQSVAQEVAE